MSSQPSLAYRRTPQSPSSQPEKPTVVLIHGFPLDGRMWRHQMDALGEAFDVIVPDLSGFGESSQFATGGALKMAFHADTVVELLDELAVSRAAFVGLSMGGYVVWELWRRHAARCLGLALVDTKAVADSDAARANRELAAREALDEGILSLVDGMTPKLVASAAPERVKEELRMIMLSTPDATFAAAQRGMAMRSDATELLGEIQTPCVAIGGEHDLISPPDEMAAFAAAMPNCRWVPIAGAGHMAPMENPEAVNAALLKWLSEAAEG